MDIDSYLRFAAALVFVLALMAGLWMILRRLGLASAGTGRADRRLRVIESLPLDAKHRAILIQRDNTQHLVILGPAGDTVVESKIPPTAAAADDIKPI